MTENRQTCGETLGPMDIIDFLRARISEEEALARRAQATFADDVEGLPDDTRGHVERHSPEHVLADCESRRIALDVLRAWRTTLEKTRGVDALDASAETVVLELMEVVKPMASTYLVHPDWDENWGPISVLLDNLGDRPDENED